MVRLLFALILACQPSNNSPPPSAPASAADDTNLRQKISMKLRDGKPLSDRERTDFARLGLESFTKKMMESREFADTIFRFNLYVLGMDRPQISLQYNAKMDHRAAFYSAAVHSAQNLARGDSYFALLEPTHPIYAQPSAMTAAEIDEVLNSLSQSIDRVMQALRRGMRVEDLCRYAPVNNTEGFANEIVPVVGEYFIRAPSYLSVIAKVRSLCGDQEDEQLVSPEDADEIERLARQDLELVRQFRDLAKDLYAPTSVVELRSVNLEGFALHPEDEKALRQSWLWLALRNSSTNYNRKRASYILKRFMCDDLTPIAVDTPAVHTADEHGSQASCRACHYKLDPMAGYFREYGAFGHRQNPDLPPLFSSFSEASNSIVFDDFAFKPWAEYVAHWSERESIGIVRSTNPSDPSNIYPEGERGVDELFAALRQHPDVHQCLVRKSLEFFVSPDLTIDSQLLKKMSAAFTTTLKQKGSTPAIKELITNVVSTKSFAAKEIVPGVCYDRETPSTVPCRISGIIDDYCSSCHNSQRQTAGLDLTTWDDAGTPVMRSEKGILLTQNETFKRITQALNTDNPKLRMPLGKVMSAQDRDALFNYFSGVAP